jgi:hypothetical protein
VTRKGPHDSSHLQGPATVLLPQLDSAHGHGQPGRSGPPGNTNARTHGTHSLKRAVQVLAKRVINRRTSGSSAGQAGLHRLDP